MLTAKSTVYTSDTCLRPNQQYIPHIHVNCQINSIYLTYMFTSKSTVYTLHTRDPGRDYTEAGRTKARSAIV